MGASHARAYHRMPEFTIAGLVSRGEASRRKLNAELGSGYKEFSSYEQALAQVKPDAVCISTYSDTHADYAVMAMEAGAHVFLEKPVADTLADAERVIAAARRTKRALVVGYILQVHPSWQKFTDRGTRLPQARHTDRTDPATAGALRRAGFDVISFAGNHCMDWGP